MKLAVSDISKSVLCSICCPTKFLFPEFSSYVFLLSINSVSEAATSGQFPQDLLASLLSISWHRHKTEVILGVHKGITWLH
jgi:hypothetical protein